MSYNDTENLKHVRFIAEILEAYANGDMYKDEDGCTWSVYTEGEAYQNADDSLDFWQYDENTNTWIRTSTDATTENDPSEDWEQLSLYDYFEDVLDIEYRVGGRHEEPRSVRVMVACGGPNIYIDTATSSIELYWWGDRASYPLSHDANDAVNDLFIELWSC